MNVVKLFFSKYWLHGLGVVIGGIVGYIYWCNWGCEGGCPITASPIRTTLYGAVLGGLLFSLFARKKSN